VKGRKFSRELKKTRDVYRKQVGWVRKAAGSANRENSGKSWLEIRGLKRAAQGQLERSSAPEIGTTLAARLAGKEGP